MSVLIVQREWPYVSLGLGNACVVSGVSDSVPLGEA